MLGRMSVYLWFEDLQLPGSVSFYVSLEEGDQHSAMWEKMATY